MTTAQLYILKVIALTKGSKENITLPPLSNWTNSNGSIDDWKKLCEEINGLDNKYRAKISIDTKGLENNVDPGKYKDCLKGTRVFEYDKLPVDFLWVNGALLLQSPDKLGDAVQAHFPGISDIVNLASEMGKMRATISTMERETVRGCLQKLTLGATYNVLFSTDNSETEGNNNRNIAYEFLQNADDSKRRNVPEGVTIENDFEVTEKSDNCITLTYSEPGFSLWDFYCIVSRGDSGNVEVDNHRLEGSTGHFGTGFKSIYTLCDCVKIESSGFCCTLKPLESLDEIQVNSEFITACKAFIQPEERTKVIERSRTSPIPLFDETTLSGKTTITLHFMDSSKKETFCEVLYNPASYVFLKNLKCPKDPLIGTRFSGERIEPDIGEKIKLELFFPETVPEEQDSLPLYCTLPMDKCDIKFPFYVNIPSLHPTDTRETYHDSDDNNCLLDTIFAENGVLTALFAQFASDNSDRAYRFFPYELYKNYRYNYRYKNLAKIPFIPCVNFEKPFCSIADIEGGKVHLLTQKVYEAARDAGVAPAEDIPYVSGEAGLYLLGKITGLTTTVTVADKLMNEYNSQELKEEVSAKIREILPDNRIKLYYDGVTLDDTLLKTLLAFSNLSWAQRFWDELGDKATALFNSGMVVYMGADNRYHVSEQGKRYYMDDSDKVKSERVILEPKIINVTYIKEACRTRDFLLSEEEALVTDAVKAYSPVEAIWERFGEAADGAKNPRLELLYRLFTELIGSKGVVRFEWKEGVEPYLDRGFFKAVNNCRFIFGEKDAKRYSKSENSELYHLYRNTVSAEIRSEVAGTLSLFEDDSDESLSQSSNENNGNPANALQAVMRFRQIDKRVTGWVFGLCDNTPCVVLMFGEGMLNEAMGKFLNDRFDCNTFAAAKHYSPMVTAPVDLIYGFIGDKMLCGETPFGENPTINEIAECALRDVRNPLMNDKDLMLQRLKSTYSLEWNGHIYDFHGYGRYKKSSPVCPVCGGVMLIESDAARLGSILVGKQGSKVEFPMLLCGNCYHALSYIREAEVLYTTDRGEVPVSEALLDGFLDNFFRRAEFKLKLTFSNTDPDAKRITKTVPLKMTFLHKAILLDKLYPKLFKELGEAEAKANEPQHNG